MEYIKPDLFRCLVGGLISLLMVCWLTGCASSAGVRKPAFDGEESFNNQATSMGVESINLSLQQQSNIASKREYRLGNGDAIDIAVYQVEELSRNYQINSKGAIQMPLLGSVILKGLTVDEAESLLVNKLGENYVLEPQVTINITEYSANEISVTGAVGSPQIFNLKQGRTPIEMLIMAGGLTKNAGREMYINTAQRDTVSNEIKSARIIVELAPLFDPRVPEDYQLLQKVKNIVLKDGDSVHVPSAGVVYIDGAIKSPGSYEMADDTTLLSLLALAGGAEWEASKSKIKVIRKIDRNNNEIFKLNLNRIRNNKEKNFKLKSGDLVLVGESSFKSGLKAFWEYGISIILLGGAL